MIRSATSTLSTLDYSNDSTQL
ncbi:hypothetical protein RRG08_067248, partial [Elysia crispata]